MMRLKFSRGFTLVELMVTIAVMAIIASIAAPSFSAIMNSYQLNQSAKQMMLALKEGRSRAATINAAVVVCPNKNTSGQEVTKNTCLSGADLGSEINTYINENRVILANITKDVNISATNKSFVIFTAKGTIKDETSRTYTLCLEKEAREINVSILGAVYMEKGTCA
ncbi:pilus assembly FimT family protein [Acinetobacter populi]|uniref:Type II secretion system protein H n=1 Tax=Acinetobacter populi TaxID=1582270 RepID=A0A1Z9YWK6_9GAMM|nr:GspH/FimT family pseudopilin [Acinetobacter populi]OUY06553.1 hypothetical protein CAP51_11520 [Acinetobacter populi]